MKDDTKAAPEQPDWMAPGASNARAVRGTPDQPTRAGLQPGLTSTGGKAAAAAAAGAGEAEADAEVAPRGRSAARKAAKKPRRR